MGKLDRRIALITGGARGQGAAEAKRFTSEGAVVYVTGTLDLDKLESLTNIRKERFLLMAELAKLPKDMVFFTQITMESAEDVEYLDAMRHANIKGVLVGEKRFQLKAGSYRVTLSREGVNPLTEQVTIPQGGSKPWTPPPPTAIAPGGGA